ncbi:lipopolysaccharide assembly protein LapA domain-containing protein [Streptomonospora algeriensis]|uniref:Lipopolysaccharide assembly protein LapA domain-containing protein n=1 Tax=Streptomonospora algeriensis TaxID=995084 RepID=A0ABW3BCE6_9ACTN
MAPEQRREPAEPARAAGMWAAMGAVVLLAAVLIVFLLSNTAQVEVAFLSFVGELPLAIALLIAMVAGSVITLILAATHLTRLRHRARGRR